MRWQQRGRSPGSLDVGRSLYSRTERCGIGLTISSPPAETTSTRTTSISLIRTITRPMPTLMAFVTLYAHDVSRTARPHSILDLSSTHRPSLLRLRRKSFLTSWTSRVQVHHYLHWGTRSPNDLSDGICSILRRQLHPPTTEKGHGTHRHWRPLRLPHWVLMTLRLRILLSRSAQPLPRHHLPTGRTRIGLWGYSDTAWGIPSILLCGNTRRETEIHQKTRPLLGPSLVTVADTASRLHSQRTTAPSLDCRLVSTCSMTWTMHTGRIKW